MKALLDQTPKRPIKPDLPRVFSATLVPETENHDGLKLDEHRRYDCRPNPPLLRLRTGQEYLPIPDVSAQCFAILDNPTRGSPRRRSARGLLFPSRSAPRSARNSSTNSFGGHCPVGPVTIGENVIRSAAGDRCAPGVRGGIGNGLLRPLCTRCTTWQIRKEGRI